MIKLYLPTLFFRQKGGCMGLDLKGKFIGEKISQRKDGRYQARYIDRFGKRKTIYSRSLKDIKKKLTEAEYMDQNYLNVKTDMTVDEWYHRWMAIYKIPNIRRNTKRNYESVYLKHISPAIGNIQLSKVRNVHIQQIINSLKNNGYQWETQNKVRVILNDMYTYAIADELAMKNPCKGIRTASQKPKTDARCLTREEQALFFECCAGRWYDNLFNVAINTGLRPGELAALTWDDIDIKNMVIHVKHTLVYQKFDGDSKKTYHLEDCKVSTSRRSVPINELCLKYLKRQYIQKNVLSRRCSGNSVYSDRLFVTRRNNPINAMDYSSAIREVLKDVNEILDSVEQIEVFSGHAFRHTFATRCIESGMRPKTLQALLGHTSLNTTMDMYVHVEESQKQGQMDLLENSFSPWENIEEVFKQEQRIVNFT